MLWFWCRGSEVVLGDQAWTADVAEAGRERALLRLVHARYLPNKVLAREYRLRLPAEKQLAAEIEKTRERLEGGAE